MHHFVKKPHMPDGNYFFFLLFPLLFCLLVLGCKSDAEKKTGHFEKGNAFAAKKDFKSAIIEYKNAIQIDPRFEKAQAAIADAYIADANPKGAYTALASATELNPDNLDAQLKLATLLFLSKEYDRARERVDIVLAKDPGHPEALLLSAGLFEQARDLTSAESLYRRLLDAHPENVAARVAYSRILGRLDRGPEQEKILMEGLAGASKKDIVYLSLYALYISQEKFDKAERILLDGIAAMPKDTNLHATLGQFHLGMKQPEKAEAAFKKAVEAAPDKPQSYRMLANFYRQTGKKAQAVEVLQAALPAYPDDMEMRLDLAQAYLATQQAESAKRLIDEIEKKRPGYAPVKLVRSEILVAEKEFDKALEQLDPLIESQPDNAHALFLRAVVHLGKKRLTQAKTDVLKSLEHNGGHLPARKLLADIFYSEKSFDLAQKEFAKVLERTPRDRDTLIKYGNALLAVKDARKAREAYQRYIDQYPKDAEGYFRMGGLEMRERKPAEAERHLLHARQIDPERVDIVLQLAAVYAGQKKFAQAVELCDEQLGRYADKKPLAAVVLKTKGDLLAAGREFGKAQQAYEAAIGQNPDFAAAYFSLARLYMDRNETEKAVSQYRIVLEKDPDSVPAHMILGTIYQAKGAFDQAQEHYRKALKADPEFAPAANNLSYLLSDRDQNIDEALSLAQKVKGKMPESPFVMDTLGWAYYKKGLYDLAILEFTEALEKAPDQPMIHFHLAMAHHQKGENEKAREQFERALALDEKFEAANEARRILSNL